jgi:hypothetical protein
MLRSSCVFYYFCKTSEEVVAGSGVTRSYFNTQGLTQEFLFGTPHPTLFKLNITYFILLIFYAKRLPVFSKNFSTI